MRPSFTPLSLLTLPLCLCLLLLAGCTVSYQSAGPLPQPTTGTQSQRDEVEHAAREYLGMLDRGEYDATWESAGPALRAQSSRFAWVNAMKLLRKTLPAAPECTVGSIGFTPKVDANAPVGEYAFAVFEGTAGSAATTERVVLQKEQARWKIVGYFMYSKVKLGG